MGRAAALRPGEIATAWLRRTLRAVAAAARTAIGVGAAPIAVYLADTRRPFDQGFGETALGGPLCLGGAPPEARYDVRSLDPQTGRWSDRPPVAADSEGRLRVAVPAFREDLLVELIRMGGGASGT